MRLPATAKRAATSNRYNELLAQIGASVMNNPAGARGSWDTCKRKSPVDCGRSTSPRRALLRHLPKVLLKSGHFGRSPVAERDNYRMKCINVESTFAKNNPEFSSAEQAVQYAEHMQLHTELNIPPSTVLVLINVIFSDRYLTFIFENSMALRFGIEGSRILASYGASGGEGIPPELAEEEDCVNLRFVKSENSFEWHPRSILKSVLKQELLDWYQLKNQYYLYFENTCVFIRTLFNVDDGAFFLFWTPTD